MTTSIQKYDPVIDYDAAGEEGSEGCAVMEPDPTGKWVRFADAQAEIERLRSIIDSIYSWVICDPIAPPEDMAQSFPLIQRITDPDYKGNGKEDVV